MAPRPADDPPDPPDPPTRSPRPTHPASWTAHWTAAGYYGADAVAVAGRPPAEVLSMVMPPPNVTGSLHLGHALTCAVEDCLAWWSSVVTMLPTVQCRIRTPAPAYPGSDAALLLPLLTDNNFKSIFNNTAPCVTPLLRP